MRKTIQILPRWLPALLVMVVIFLFSARPGSELPNFGWADGIVKKGGHMTGYATMLAISYLYAFRMQGKKGWLCWILAVCYAVTDEVHQSFVPGRHATLWDVVVFDNLGALIPMWIFTVWGRLG